MFAWSGVRWLIASVGTTEYPAGVTFGIHYTGIPGSYMEIPVR